MKLKELEIVNTRGIKSAVLVPDGANLVVYGPNGSGKSAVVDALDFLLTGRIGRLTGQGTKGLTLKDYGPHVDHTPKDAYVRAIVELPSYGKPVELRRDFATPNVLSYDKAAEVALAPILLVAQKSQHVLSRRQILRYIAAEPGKRAEYVQELLDLNQLEEIRKALVRIENFAKGALDKAQLEKNAAELGIIQTLQQPRFSLESVTSELNRLRVMFGGDSVEALSAAAVQADLAPPSAIGAGAVPSLSDAENVCKHLDSTVDSALKTVSDQNQALKDASAYLEQNRQAADALRKLQLYRIGIGLIEEDGSCPLCGTAWASGELKIHLERHIASAADAQATNTRIQTAARVLQGGLVSVRESVRRARDLAHKLALAETEQNFETWDGEITRWSEAISAIPEKGTGDAMRADDIARDLVSNPTWPSSKDRLLDAARAIGVTKSPHQAAWDTLTRLAENLKRYESASAALLAAEKVALNGNVARTAFEEARDSVLEGLYLAVQDRFAHIYRSIHKEDEAGFEAELRPDGPALNLKVDFYKRGKFPPLAVHSEGHQDTMGIALYLALAERLTAGTIELTILDDVVMSVDAGHRRQICEILKDEFPGRQFIITTHERMWARQLRSAGVVTGANSVEFSRWTIEDGPMIGSETVMWDAIDQQLKEANPVRAAHLLRRGCEERLEQVCNRLRAEVVYKSDENWELGDFAPAAYRRYKQLLVAARQSARSWTKKDDEEALKEIETVAAQVFNGSMVEQWVTNGLVHYSRWVECSPADLRPVVDAFRSFLELFECVNCSDLLFVSQTNRQDAALTCICGKVSWNLMLKKKATVSAGSRRLL